MNPREIPHDPATYRVAELRRHFVRRRDHMLCGIARADITPPLGTPCSLGLDDECERVLDTPYVRALVFDDGATAACLLSADVIGLGQQAHADLGRAVAAATGIPAEGVLAHGTHSHESATVMVDENRELERFGLVFARPAYYQVFIAAAADAARRAWQSRAPVTAAWGRGRVEGVASNRRIIDEQGQVLMRYSNSTAELRDYPEGDIDPYVRALRLTREDGSGEAISLNYCCHPTAAGGDEERYVTGTSPARRCACSKRSGPAAQRRGGPSPARPGRACTYFTGPCGDINPGKYTGDRGTPDDRIRDVERLGARLAAGARAALAEVRPVALGQVRLARLPLALPHREGLRGVDVLEAELERAVASYREAKRRGERVPGGGDIRRLVHSLAVQRASSGGAVQTEVAALGLGEAAFCFLPGECFLEIGRALWSAYPNLALQVVAPADYTPSYIAVPEAYAQGGYETSVAQVGPEAFGLVVEAGLAALAQVV